MALIAATRWHLLSFVAAGGRPIVVLLLAIIIVLVLSLMHPERQCACSLLSTPNLTILPLLGACLEVENVGGVLLSGYDRSVLMLLSWKLEGPVNTEFMLN